MTSPRGRRGWTLWRTLERAMPMFGSEQRDDIRYLAEPAILRTDTPPHVSSDVAACLDAILDAQRPLNRAR